MATFVYKKLHRKKHIVLTGRTRGSGIVPLECCRVIAL